MRIFISGGCKNGKSYHAQRLAKMQQREGLPLYYIATMNPVDGEDRERILRHQKEREGWGFTTVEQPANIQDIYHKCDPKGSFLLDSTTALLAEEMFAKNGKKDCAAAEKVTGDLTALLEKCKDIVLVSDYIYSDAILYDPLTEEYRKSLAKVDCAVAKLCDVVLEVSYTNVTVHKGGESYQEIL